MPSLQPNRYCLLIVVVFNLNAVVLIAQVEISSIVLEGDQTVAVRVQAVIKEHDRPILSCRSPRAFAQDFLGLLGRVENVNVLKRIERGVAVQRAQIKGMINRRELSDAVEIDINESRRVDREDQLEIVSTRTDWGSQLELV